MPELIRDLTPTRPSIHFELAPTINALESLQLLTEAETLSGFADWVNQTAQVLWPELKAKHHFVMQAFDPLFFVVFPPVGVMSNSLPVYLDALAAQDPVVLRDGILSFLVNDIPRQHPEQVALLDAVPSAEALLANVETYANYMIGVWPECHDDIATFREAHRYLQQPSAMLDLIVSHLRQMWNDYLAIEWERVQPLLAESVAAFEQLDFFGQSLVEIVRTVTNRDVREWMEKKLKRATKLVFVPSAHIGPYIAAAMLGTEATVYVYFGARLPRHVTVGSSALSRAELLIRLNALADDTRLRILELLRQHDELCAQDIIERLDLSQSTISRHLSQLSATGYITERRKDVAKCYSLNTDRVVDTVRALTNFMARS